MLNLRWYILRNDAIWDLILRSSTAFAQNIKSQISFFGSAPIF